MKLSLRSCRSSGGSFNRVQPTGTHA